MHASGQELRMALRNHRMQLHAVARPASIAFEERVEFESLHRQTPLQKTVLSLIPLADHGTRIVHSAPTAAAQDGVNASTSCGR